MVNMIKPCVTQLIMGTANVFYKMLFYFTRKRNLTLLAERLL